MNASIAHHDASIKAVAYTDDEFITSRVSHWGQMTNPQGVGARVHKHGDVLRIRDGVGMNCMSDNGVKEMAGALACILLLCASTARAGPTDGQVVAGAADIQQSGSTFNINQSTNHVIINWQDFSVDAGESVNFNLPGANSAVLNRVTSASISQINGLLQSNGQVFLINPNGVVIGPNGQINTQSFIASTLNVTDADFMAEGDMLFSGNSDASIVNHGSISAVGGDIILIARTVENHGTLSAPNGTVGLAAATEVLLQDSAEERLLVRVGANNVSIHNTGNIEAIAAELKTLGGNIYALAINNDGLIRATGVEEREGRVYLVAQNAAVKHSGTIEARTGEVRVLGDDVTLVPGSLIDVSGTSGNGGFVLIGGSFQGKDPDILGSSFTMVDFGSVILANGGASGDGGTVIIWSDVDTRFGGSINARGGALAGDGGFVEVSGKQRLAYRGHVDVNAPLGNPGSLLLDPEDVTIANGAGASAPTSDWDDRDVAWSITIYEADIEAFVGVLYVSADNDIIINDLADNELTLQATDASILANNETGLTNQGGVLMRDTNDTIRMTSAGAPLTLQGGRIASALKPRVASFELGHIISNGGDVNLITKRANPADPIFSRNVTTNGGNFKVDRIDASNSANVSFTSQGLVDTAGGNVTVFLVGNININAGINVGAGLLSFSGTNTNLNSAITATGNVTINSILNFGTGSSISTDGTITFTSTASMLPGGSLTLSGSDFDFQNTFTGNAATLTLQPNLVSGDMAIDATTFGNLSGFSLLTLGRVDGTGTATLTGAIAINDPFTLIMGGVGGTINQTGTITGIDDASVIYTAGTMITIDDTIDVPDGITLTAPTINVNAPIDAGSGDVTLTGTTLNINDTLAGTGSLFIRPNAALDSFTVTANTFLNLSGFADYTIGRVDGTGTATIAGMLNISDPLTILIGGVGGSIHQTGTVVGVDNSSITYTAGGSVIVDGSIDVPDGVTLIAPDITINAAIDAGAGNITLTSDTLAINDTLTATGNLLIAPTDPTSTIGLGDGAIGTLNLTTADIANIQPGFTQITIGSATGSGDIDIRIADFTSPLTIRAPTLDGDITVNGAFTNTSGLTTLTAGDTITIASTGSITTNDGDLTLNANESAGGGTISLAGDISTNGGTVSLPDAVLLDNAAGVNILAGNGNITFSTILNSTATTTPLTITAGNVDFNAAIGAINPLGSLNITTSGTLTIVAAADAIITGSFTHSGAGSASLAGDITTSAGSITFNSPVAIDTAVTFIAGGAGSDFILNNDITKSVGVASSISVSAADRIILSSGSSIISSSGALDITFTADALDMTDTSLQSTGNLTFQPLTPGTTIGIGDIASGTLNLTATELTYIQDGFTEITFGDATAGNIDISTWTVDDPVTLISAADVTINGPLAVTTNGLTIDSDGIVTQSAPIATDALLLLGAGTFTLDDPANNVGRLAANLTGGSLFFLNGASVLVGSVHGVDGVTNSGSTVTLIADGATSDVTLDEAVSGAGAGTSVVLVSGRNFINNVGAGVINPGAGRFLVYSTDPADNTLNGLVAGKLYNRNYTDDPPPTIATPGNLLLYSIAPVLDITADNKSKVYGSANPAFTYTPTGFIDGDTALTSLTGDPSLTTTADATSDVGFYSIDAAAGTLTSPLGYTLNFVNGQLEITQAPLTITADDASRAYGASDPAFTASYIGFLNGDDDSVISNLTFSTPATVLSGVGDYALSPMGATALNYSITFVDGTLSITPATLIITADDTSRLYGSANPAFTANYTGFVNGDDDTLVIGLTFSTPADLLSPVGDYDIIPADAVAGPNYTVVFVDGMLTVNPAPLTITADDATRQYGAANPAFTASYLGFLNGDDATDVSGLDFTAPGVTANAGNHNITPFGATASNYDITFINGTLTITQAPLLITANDASRDYGASDPAFTATYVGFLNGDDASDISNLDFSTPATVLSGVGDYTLSPINATAINYAIAFADGTLTINPATLTITADDLARTYGSANPALTVNYAGFANDDDDSLIVGLTIATPADINSPVGDYNITPADADAGPNYNIVFVNGTLTVDPATLTITANNASRFYGSPNPALTVNYAGFVNGQDESIVADLTITTPATLASNIGNYAIVPADGSAPNYNIVFANGSLSVNPVALNITANDFTRTYGSPNPIFTADYSGFVNGDDATVISGLTFSSAEQTTGIGAYDITPSGAIATNYDITFTIGSLIITPAALSITAANKSRVLNVANPPLTATYIGLMAWDDPSVVTGLTLTTTADLMSPAGDYTILAAGALADNYDITLFNGTLTILMMDLAGVQEIIQQNDRKLTDQFQTVLTSQPIGASNATVVTPKQPAADLATADNKEFSASHGNYRIYYRVTDSADWTMTYRSDSNLFTDVLAADSSFSRPHVSTSDSATASVNPAGLSVE